MLLESKSAMVEMRRAVNDRNITLGIEIQIIAFAWPRYEQNGVQSNKEPSARGFATIIDEYEGG